MPEAKRPTKRRRSKRSIVREGILKRSILAVVVIVVATVGLVGVCTVAPRPPSGVNVPIVLLLWLLGMPFLASMIAGRKNRSPARWFFLTILFGGIPLLFILFLPTVQPQQGLTAEDSRELLELLRERKDRGGED